MKLATYNLNGIRARLPRLLEWLEREQPDIACLQEFKCADEALPIADIEAAGYGAVWHGQKGFNGVAVLAERRCSPSCAASAFPAIPTTPTAAISRRRSAGFVVGIALPAQRQSGRHREVRLQARVDGTPRRPCRGAAGGRAADRPRAATGTSFPRTATSSRSARRRNDARDAAAKRAQACRRILHQGWTDALRALHPREEKLYTFWDYTAGCWQRDLGFRLDHLLCSPEAADRLQGAGVDKWARAQEKASDHAPTWVELS